MPEIDNVRKFLVSKGIEPSLVDDWLKVSEAFALCKASLEYGVEVDEYEKGAKT